MAAFEVSGAGPAPQPPSGEGVSSPRPVAGGDIPGYEVLGVIARGGMGVVLKARQSVLRRVVALKLPLAHLTQTRTSRERFLREARSAARLHHPHICQIFEVGQHRDRPYIAMAYVEGRTLRDWAKCVRPNARQIAEMVAKLARAVGYAHGHGIVHRDIKPANVLVDSESGEPVLTDFGLAKEFAPESSPAVAGQLTPSQGMVTQSGQVLGTPAYMAPEQAAGRLDQLGPATDVYALGAVLYELLCDRPPFLGTVGEILKLVQTEDPLPPRRRAPRVHRDLDTLCMKALAREPAARYASAVALAEDLERFGAGEPILARREGPGRKLLRKARKNPVLTAALVLALASGVGSAAFFATASRARQLATLDDQLRAELEHHLDRADGPDHLRQHLERADALAAQVERLDAVRGAAARRRVSASFAAFIQEQLHSPRLGPEEQSRIEGELAELGARDPDEATLLRRALAERVGGWEPALTLEPPFAGAGVVFDPSTIEIARDFVRAKPDTLKLGGLLVKTSLVGNLRVNAEFDLRPGRDVAIAMGLWPVANRSDGWSMGESPGYCFSLSAKSEPAAGPGAATRPSHAPLVARIFRSGRLLREARFEGRLGDGPLPLLVTRAGDRLELQAGGMSPVTVDDDLPLPLTDPVTPIFATGDASLIRLRIDRQLLPARPSPLERGDAQYARGQLAEAAEEFRAQAAAADGDLRDEARYKRGLCLLELHRDDEATALFAQVAAGAGERWPARAMCQLLLRRLAEKRFDDADTIFESLAARYSPAKLASLMSPEAATQMAHLYEGEGGMLNSTAGIDERRVRRIELFPVACEVAGRTTDADRTEAAFMLARAYHLLGRIAKAREVAEVALAETVAGDDRGWRLSLLAEYGWLLRQSGDAAEAERVLGRELFNAEGRPRANIEGGKHGAFAVLEACRVAAARGQRGRAEELVDWCLKRAKPGTSEYLDACLIRGFLLERRGDGAGAAAWAAGVTEGGGQAPTGHGRLDACILGSLTGRWNDARAVEWLETLTAGAAVSDFTKSGSNPLTMVTRGLFKVPPSVVLGMWRTPRGHELARRLAFQEMTRLEYVRAPVYLFTAATLQDRLRREAPTPPRAALAAPHPAPATGPAAQPAGTEGEGPALLTADQEALCWDLAHASVEGYYNHKITSPQVMQLAGVWMLPNTRPIWEQLAPKLEPEVRAGLAYLLAHHRLHEGQADEAAAFYDDALRDAPANGPLRRAARMERDLLPPR